MIGASTAIMAEEGNTPAEPVGGAAGNVRNKYRQILGLGAVHWLSLFALIYVGVEVTLGGMYSRIHLGFWFFLLNDNFVLW